MVPSVSDSLGHTRREEPEAQSPGKRQSERATGVAKDKFPRLHKFPRESTILLSRIMDFKMPRKAESAVRWAGLLLTVTFFSELGGEINQTLLTPRAPSKSLGSVHCGGSKHIYIINPKLKGNGA